MEMLTVVGLGLIFSLQLVCNFYIFYKDYELPL